MKTRTLSLSFPKPSPQCWAWNRLPQINYYELMTVSRGSGPEAQRGMALCPRRPSEVGRARTFPGKREGQGRHLGL